MATPEPGVAQLRPNPPTEVSLTKADRNVRFTPRELEAIKTRYERSLSQLVDDDESDDKLVVLAWLKLRRAGHEIDLDGMQDVIVSLEGETAPDPSSGSTGETSPPSATSGE